MMKVFTIRGLTKLVGPTCICGTRSRAALLRPHGARGQLALETAFVFGLMIFLVFSIVNFGIIFHTKNVATYAAFMAARSYEVMGDYDRGPDDKRKGPDLDVTEVLKAGGKATSFMGNAKTAAPYQVAEDIFTCGLPWVTVPDGDGDPNAAQNSKSVFARCQEGKRKYKNMNVGDSARFQPMAANNALEQFAAGRATQLNKVDKGFHEAGRTPLQYGVMSLQFKKKILFNPFSLIVTSADSPPFVDEVFVPVLLNPGLDVKLKKDDKKGKEFKEDAATK